MEDSEEQLDMFQQSTPKSREKPKSKPTPQQVAAVVGLNYDPSKIRPYTVVRVNPTTVCILHD